MALFLFVSLYLQAVETENTPSDDTNTDTSTTETNSEAVKETTANNTKKDSAIQRSVPSSQAIRMLGLASQLSKNSSHEMQTLNFNGEDFLALFRDATTGDTQGCIILLHGDNEHPDWPNVIHPIRTKLNENSWCTLSIEVPDVYPKESISIATPFNSIENETQEINLPNQNVIFGRIDTAMDFLDSLEYETLTLLGHRTGASYALKYSADNALSEGVLIIISPISPSNINSFDMSQAIESINIPILDYYFDVSSKEVRFAQERQNAANKRIDKSIIYQQIKALPDQRDQAAGEKRLTQRVWGFLKQNTQQKNQQRALPSSSKGLFHKTDF